MALSLPHIGAKGRYVLKAPLDTRVGNKVYTCIGVRSFTDVIRQGRDPFGLYYTKLELEELDYERDLKDTPYFISLQEESGKVVVVPAYYIESFPAMGGIAYEVIGLVVNLGALPIDLVLTHVHNAVKDTVLGHLGITPEVQSVKLSETDYVSAEDHANIEAARDLAIENRKTMHARLLEAQARIQELESERDALLGYVDDLTP